MEIRAGKKQLKGQGGVLRSWKGEKVKDGNFKTEFQGGSSKGVSGTLTIWDNGKEEHVRGKKGISNRQRLWLISPNWSLGAKNCTRRGGREQGGGGLGRP